MSTLKERVTKLEQRNYRVETDKAWELSLTRKILIALFIYLAIALYLQYIIGISPWVNAIVPSVGFLLSTLTLPFFKKLWIQYMYKHETEEN